MSDPRPKLAVVPGGANRESQPSPPRPEAATDRQRSQRSSHWAWLVLVVVALAAVFFENRRAGGLAREVASLENVVVELEAELTAAESTVSAHRAHLAEVRSLVSGLSELVERDPQPDPAP